jgi:hemerythrin
VMWCLAYTMGFQYVTIATDYQSAPQHMIEMDFSNMSCHKEEHYCLLTKLSSDITQTGSMHSKSQRYLPAGFCCWS